MVKCMYAHTLLTMSVAYTWHELHPRRSMRGSCHELCLSRNGLDNRFVKFNRHFDHFRCLVRAHRLAAGAITIPYFVLLEH